MSQIHNWHPENLDYLEIWIKLMSRSPKKLVYLDHAATTPLDPQVLTAMRPFLSSEFGNPSALYDLGVRARKAIDTSRKTIAEFLHTTPDTITFTSGGTESNNLAIFGVVNANTPHGHPPARGESPTPPRRGGTRGGLVNGHIITTPIEHDSVLGPVENLKKQGYNVTYVKVDKYGFVNPQEIIRAIRPETILISIMYANNEIGTIEPIAEIGRMILRYRKEHKSVYPYFHTDACQAAGYLDLDVEKLHVDLMTLNGGKIYGPKGVGLLYVRRGVKIEPLFYGGNQEHALRPGTENVAGIVGLGKAFQITQIHRDKEIEILKKLSQYFWKELQKKIPGVKLNGPEIGEHRLPNNLNVEFPGVECEALLLYLNEAGIMCSTSSACGLESNEPSHVLRAIGLTLKQVNGSLRFSLGHSTTQADTDFVLKVLKKNIKLVAGTLS